MNDKYLKSIDAYLAGELEGVALKQFEQEINSNPQLQEQVETYRELTEEFEESSDYNSELSPEDIFDVAFTKALYKVYKTRKEEIVGVQAVSKEQDNKPNGGTEGDIIVKESLVAKKKIKEIPIKEEPSKTDHVMQIRKLMSLAAAVFILVIAYFIFVPEPTEHPNNRWITVKMEDILDRKNDPILGIEDADKAFFSIVEQITANNYGEALDSINEYLNKYPKDDNIRFFESVAILNLDAPIDILLLEKAESNLKEIMDTGEYYGFLDYSEVSYFLSFCYLKQGEIEKAKELINELNPEDCNDYVSPNRCAFYKKLSKDLFDTID